MAMTLERVVAGDLVLRAYRSADEAALLECFTDESTARWNPGRANGDVSAWWQRRNDWSDGAHASWAVADSDDTLLGSVSIFKIDPAQSNSMIGYKQWVREDVACVLRLPASAARERLSLASELVQRLPATLQAVGEAQISLAHARRLAEAVSPLSHARVGASTGTGVIGQPSLGTAANGQAALQRLAEKLGKGSEKSQRDINRQVGGAVRSAPRAAQRHHDKYPPTPRLRTTDGRHPRALCVQTFPTVSSCLQESPRRFRTGELRFRPYAWNRMPPSYALVFVTMSALRPASDGAPPAFDDVYRDDYRSMVFLARATTQSVDVAEEIVQDAFVQLYQRWDQVREPRAWLRRAVISLCTSWVRRTVRARSARMTAPAESMHDPDAALDVWSALSRLPPRQRAAVVLRYVDDVSERDIAHALGCHVGTVKSTLSRARQTLRSELTDDSD